jgi:hypothetical protein
LKRWENDIEAGSHHNVLSLSKEEEKETHLVLVHRREAKRQSAYFHCVITALLFA